MAGEWIKMRTNLWDDPRVSSLCDLTDQPEAMVVGGLYWLWAMADEHSEDGFLPGMTLRAVDRKTGVTGLGDALVQIGWVSASADGVQVINFDEHNGASAKRRCMEAKRKATGRKESASDADTNGTPCVAREEKSKDLNPNPPVSPRGVDTATGSKTDPKPKRKTRIPDPFLVNPVMAQWAQERAPKVDLKRETDKFVNYWRGEGGTKADWVATWRTWMLKAQEYAMRFPARQGGQPQGLNMDDTTWASDLGDL